MPSFRCAKAQAEHASRAKTSHGIPRHNNRTSGFIHSIGSERNYTQALICLTKWLQANLLGDLKGLTVEHAHQYLNARSGQVSQKSLDLDRQAIQIHLCCTLKRFNSTKPASTLASKSRAYSPGQLLEISQLMPENFALALRIALSSGLRACELLTLAPQNERQASGHRRWSTNRFIGRKNQARYTVIGKGGLVREITIPKDVAEQLEKKRLPQPQKISDRGVHRLKLYDIPGGKIFSGKFSEASKEALGFSLGAHGLRHTYSQERILEIQAQGFSIIEAKGITAQELGHFSMTTTEAYLR